MTIGKKIVLSTTGMVFLAVLLTVVSVLTFLNQGINLQARELIKELDSQSEQRINTGKKVLHIVLAEYIQRISYVAANLCRDEALRESLQEGQWKALSSISATACMNAGIDFMVIFDTKGRVMTTFPSQMDEVYPETHFKGLGLFKNFTTAIVKKDLTAVPIVSAIEKWDQKTQAGYNINGNDAGEIVIVSVGIIPNEFFDEPIGYILSGVKSNRLSVLFDHFFKTTGLVCILADKNKPLVWAGISENKPDVGKLFQVQGAGLGKTKNKRCVFDKKVYQLLEIPFLDLFTVQGLINLPTDASMARIIIGEPAALIDNAKDKILKEGERIRHKILISTLLVSFALLALTIFIMGLIGKKIARPVALAAEMSNRIASGDLTHVLDESSTDETGTLSKAMNLMTKNLKALEEKNNHQMKALKESENRFRMLFSTSHKAIALLEMKTGKFIDANNKLCEISKYKKNEILGKTMVQLGFLSKDDEIIFGCQMAHTAVIDGSEMNFKVKDGSEKTIRFYAAPIQITDKQFFLIEFDDITEQKSLESQLKQSRKMESIGTLAGGIAHDFNNLLYMIIGNTELALGDIPAWNPVSSYLEEIKSASLKAAGIVKQLLNFSRKTDQESKPIGLVNVIGDALRFLRSTIPVNIEFRKYLPDEEIVILADPIQINQILMNICTNAAQAMENTGGLFETSVTTVTFNSKTNIGYSTLPAGDYAKITLKDTGPGIPHTLFDRIFDPYFTTREIGKGSGMGLAVVHGIVKNHNGVISVDSKPGKGTVFNVFFPVVDEKPILKIETPEGLSYGTETILFVDDEEAITKMTENLLKKLGYTVEATLNPADALKIFQSKPNRFDLVITDMTMPQMTGADLSEKIKKIRADIPVIICTGHSSLIDEDKAKQIGVAAYMMKPVSNFDLSKTIREVLKMLKKEG